MKNLLWSIGAKQQTILKVLRRNNKNYKNRNRV